ncbi:MAG: HD domain-containing phosphohydrolase [Pseudomonadota bacterium]
MTLNKTEKTTGTVLIVDDNPNNLQVLSAMLQGAGIRVRPAVSGEIALHALENLLPDLILLDIRMPGLDGFEICRRIKANTRTQDIPVIFISALNETDDKLTAFRAGGVDYIAKPFQTEEVMARIQTHLQLCHLHRHLESLVDDRTQDLETALESLQESQRLYHRMLEQTIQAIALTVEKRDPYTAGHQYRVSLLATSIAGEFGLDPGRMLGLRMGAMIHDIGKIYLPSEILSRPGRLADVEFALVKTHSEVGRDIVSHVEFPWPVADMIHQHHERLDGSGYPQGLKGDEILLEAQILTVADVVEAMASHRPYRPALGIAAALDEIRRSAGRFYQADIAAACLRLFEDRGYQLPLGQHSLHHPGLSC